jgi:signal transduction histidine kinase
LLRVRLRYRIIALTLLCLVPVAAVSTWALVRVATGYLWDEAEADAVSLADGARRVTRHAMMANEWPHVANVLHDVAMHGEVRYIRLYNARGRLKVSTDGRGADLPVASGECTQCHPNPLQNVLPEGICAHWAGHALRVYHRIPNEPACSSGSCHPPPEVTASLGLLEVETDVIRIASRVDDVRMRALLWGLVVLAAAAVPLIFCLGWAVERPMAESLRLVREVSRENFRVRSRLRRSDEWAQLWEAFDSMASSLARAQAELEALNRDLERQVQERTQELQRALMTAQESDRMKTEFLANVSHEFSTPLQGVIGYAELLLDGIDGNLAGDQRRDVQAILRNGQRLLDWVEDLLELARLDGHTRLLCVDRIRIQDLAEEAAETGRRRAAGKAVEVTCEAEPDCPAIVGDTGALRRVLLHRVENAVRHTEAGSVTIRIAKASPGWAGILVEDTGPGMAPAVLHAALNGFSSKGGGGGLAVGLTLARRLVELHGGTFEMESAPGEGTRVRLRLPEALQAEAGGGRSTGG